MERLQGKTAVVVGGGQTPGETIGNGRATALLFAREGAHVLVVDRDRQSATETAQMIGEEGGQALVAEADITTDEGCRHIINTAREAFGRIDVLHNNVGIGMGDAGVTGLDEANWDRIMDVNLKGMWRTCKHALALMRDQGGGGAIINISSVAAVAATPNLVAYKISKAGVNALTHSLAVANARYGIRANAILPGLMDTPMAVDAVAQARGLSRDDVAKARNARVPLGQTMGTAWDVAHAALFLASDEARFITGVLLPVDGGQTLLVG